MRKLHVWFMHFEDEDDERGIIYVTDEKLSEDEAAQEAMDALGWSWAIIEVDGHSVTESEVSELIPLGAYTK